jgi:uncharacterized protein (DUF433 family)
MAFGRPKSQNSHFYTTLVSSPSRIAPTDSAEEALSDYPEGNVKAVNEAWRDAGNEGTIGDTVIYKMRSEMGLTGKVRQKKSKPPKRKAVTSPPTAERTSLGKGSFVKEFLNDYPQGNVKSVNEAWTKAGMTGTISTALVDKIRASMGLTGRLRAKSKPTPATTGKKRGRPPKSSNTPVSEKHAFSPQSKKSDRTSALLHVEAEIDRLIFTVMAIGELLEVETVLRDARLKIYKAMSS